ncbi:arylamine N-acetyltransferase family protein [Pseudomonas panipatensis]|uniref:arylamine N-acetyltransferase family protein n=1 Tax=Pseudomonas panipatensis TaxID=428992 RepID=UPI0035B00403
MTPLSPFAPAELQACLARLGLPGAAPAATAANLDRLIAAALQRLPFENLDVLLQRPIHIEPEAVFAKVVEQGRGGYCFELNSLFARLLVSLGYRVSLLVGRVRWGIPDAVELTLQSHLLLRVDLDDGAYLVDIGFGGPASPRALPLVSDEELAGGWRISATRRDGELELALRSSSGWQPLYRFTLEAQQWLDYLPRNWYTSTHPDSIFRKALKVAISEADARLTLLNGQFSRRGADGQVEQRLIDDPDALIGLLRERFHLSVPPTTGEDLRTRLESLLSR